MQTTRGMHPQQLRDGIRQPETSEEQPPAHTPGPPPNKERTPRHPVGEEDVGDGGGPRLRDRKSSEANSPGSSPSCPLVQPSCLQRAGPCNTDPRPPSRGGTQGLGGAYHPSRCKLQTQAPGLRRAALQQRRHQLLLIRVTSSRTLQIMIALRILRKITGLRIP